MPPKMRITKEEIVSAGVDVVRQNGIKALNARAIATALGCSTQPIFSNFPTMGELRLAIGERAGELYREYMKREVESGEFPPYKASGMAYIRFAKEERELFKLLYMFDRSEGAIPGVDEVFGEMVELVHANTGLDGFDAELFHFEVWAFVHGIATMFATEYLDIEWDLVSHMVTDAYQGLRKQYEME